jgi:hypothetical protein
MTAPDTPANGEYGHVLVLKGHPLRDWTLECVHEPGDFFTADEDGTKTSDECWVQSWWEALSLDEMLVEDDWPDEPVARIPVQVEGDGWSDGCCLRPAPQGDLSGGRGAS